MVGLIPAGLARSRGFYPHRIDHALRLNAADSASLTWGWAADTDQKYGAFSAWFKITEFGVRSQIFGSGVTTDNEVQIAKIASDQLAYLFRAGGSTADDVSGNALYRDPSQWYHVVAIWNTTLATASDRFKLFVNGQRVTDLAATNYPAQDQNLNINNTGNLASIGRRANQLNNFFDGYVAEVIWVSDPTTVASLSPTDFGQFKNGVWVPKRYTGNYGTNGFHLDFADAANLGKDVSGNGNDFTANNITSDDQVEDTPTRNCTTLLPIDEDASGTLVEAATEVSGTVHQLSTFAVSTGKYAWETTLNANGDIGIKDTDENETTITGTSGDVIQLRLDANAGTLESNTNGGGWTSVATGLSGTFHALFKTDCSIDFGQYGYTPPAGFKPLNAANLFEKAYRTSGSYTGNGSSDGPFVYTGAAFSEVTIDGTTYTNDGSARGTVDFLANGFKLRSTTKNGNGTTYAWSGVVSQDFKYANAQVN